MGFMDGLKALVQKGPSGLVDQITKPQTDWADRYNAADKSDPVAMQALMDEQRRNMNEKIAKYDPGFLSPAMKERFNNLYDGVGAKQAAMHQVMEAQMAKTAAEAEAAAPQPPPVPDTKR